MKTSLHTVLGATGPSGMAVLSELKNRELPVRAVGRNIDLPDVETRRADQLDLQQTLRAVEGSSHVYLCIGLPYRSDVWLRDWPRVMQNTIDACAATGARLIFLDNVYMYGTPPLAVPFDETHPQEPATRKGEARKITADLLVNAFREGKIKGVIGRSADFYGPGAVLSPFYISMLERMFKGKAPQSLGKIDVPHTYAYTVDNARALVALALDESTYGEVWHLPVGRPITIEEVVGIMNAALGTRHKVSYLPPALRRVLAWFIPPLKEAAQMLYQFDNPYEMSFEKFRAHFPDFQVTPYEEGIREMIRSFGKR